jgi:hypothetical protein
MNTNFEKVRGIFLAIVEQPPAGWGTPLDEACATDRELREQVALLLEAHAGGEGILDRGVADKGSTECYEPPAERPGTACRCKCASPRTGESPSAIR